jgi:molybdenum cofactor synthesis domain-containing protein
VQNVEIVAAGNELLNGDVLDSNSNWICKRITGVGGTVQRIVLVRDNIDSISSEIQGALSRKAAIVFTLGGLGPTADDMTLQAVAKATDRSLELNSEALGLVKAKYKQLASQGFVDDDVMTPEREKMAMLPNGATPLYNPVGGAPGVFVKFNDSAVISLPGVPEELKSIFEGSLAPFLKEKFGAGVFIEKVAIVNCKDESKLAPILKTVSDSNPSVYVKSRAKRFGPDVKFRVTVSLAGSSKDVVEPQIKKTLDDLKKSLGSFGISVESIQD